MDVRSNKKTIKVKTPLRSPFQEKFCLLVSGGFSVLEATELTYRIKDEIFGNQLLLDPNIVGRLLFLAKDDKKRLRRIKKLTQKEQLEQYASIRERKARRVLPALGKRNQAN